MKPKSKFLVNRNTRGPSNMFVLSGNLYKYYSGVILISKPAFNVNSVPLIASKFRAIFDLLLREHHCNRNHLHASV